MNKIKSIFQTMGLAALFFAFTAIADAQATRTWVSGVGDDVNPCSRTAPCKTFAGAISKTAVNGEINCMDPGGFGAVTITKSITIDCTGTIGSILAAGVNGIVINITSATDTPKSVRLRGLEISGVGTGINGIRVLAANKLNVEDTVIDGFGTHGISIETGAGNFKLDVNNTKIRNNTNHGINSFTTLGTSNITVSDSQITGVNIGINLSSGTKATIRNSTISHNTTGIQAAGAEGGVMSCLIANNTTGIFSSTGGSINLFANMITQNTTGLSASGGGAILSFTNNAITGNTVNGAPTGFVPVN